MLAHGISEKEGVKRVIWGLVWGYSSAPHWTPNRGTILGVQILGEWVAGNIVVMNTQLHFQPVAVRLSPWIHNLSE